MDYVRLYKLLVGEELDEVNRIKLCELSVGEIARMTYILIIDMMQGMRFNNMEFFQMITMRLSVGEFISINRINCRSIKSGGKIQPKYDRVMKHISNLIDTRLDICQLIDEMEEDEITDYMRLYIQGLNQIHC